MGKGPTVGLRGPFDKIAQSPLKWFEGGKLNATGLPKTRSGKIMRRILRKVTEGGPDPLGDFSTLVDLSVVQHIVSGAKSL